MNFLTAILNPHRSGRRGSRLLEQLRSLRENGSSSVRFSRLLSRKLGEGQASEAGSTPSFENVRERSARESGSGSNESQRPRNDGGSPHSSSPAFDPNNAEGVRREQTGSSPRFAVRERSPSRPPGSRGKGRRLDPETEQRSGDRAESRDPNSSFRNTVRHLSETYRNKTSGGSSVELTPEERQLIRDIQQGEFQLDQPEDLRRLNRLLEKLSQAEDAASTRRGLDLAERLFGGKSNPLESLKKLLTQGETKRVREVLKGLEEFLGQLKKLASRADSQITAIIDQQFKQTLRELGFKKPTGLSELLSGSTTAEKSGGGRSGVSPSTSSLAKSFDRLQKQVARLRDALRNPEQPSNSKKGGTFTGKAKSIWEQFTNRVRELFSGQKSNPEGSGRSGSNRSNDWVNRVLRQKLTQLQKRLEDAGWKQKLRDLKTQNPGPRAGAKIGEQSSGTGKDSTSSPGTTGTPDGESTGSNKRVKVPDQQGQNSKEQTTKPSGQTRSQNGRPAGKVRSTSPDETAVPRRQPGSRTTNTSPSNNASASTNSTQSSPRAGDQPPLRAIQQQLAEKTSPSGSSPPASANAVEGTDAVLRNAVSDTGASKQAGNPGVERGLSSTKEGPKINKMAHYEANSARPASSSSGSSGSGERGHQQGLNRQTNPSFRANRSSLSKRSAEARRIIDQIVQRARTMVEEGKQTMRLQLKPEALGSMKLEVSVEAGTVSANFQVEKSPVKQTLNSHVSQLKQTLQQIGVEVDQIDISDMSTRTGEGGADWFEPESGSRRVRGGGAGDEVEGEAEAAESDASTRTYLREYSTFEHVA